MHFRRKIRNRILLVLLIVLGFIFWRGLKATTEEDFACEYKLIYAVCRPKSTTAKPPSLMEIFSAGIKF